MFCAARPASKEVGPFPLTERATTSFAPRMLSCLVHLLGDLLAQLGAFDDEEPPWLPVARVPGEPAGVEDPLDHVRRKLGICVPANLTPTGYREPGVHPGDATG